MDEIKNHWCTYGGFLGSWGFGKIVGEWGSGVEIILSEEEPIEDWNAKYIHRFPTLIEAVEHYIENRPETDIRERQETPNEVRWRARENFPSYFNRLLPVITSTQPQHHRFSL